MSQTVILGTARTPFGKMGGALSSLDATDLGGKAITSALERSEVDPEQVQAVVYGQVLQAGQGQIPSRQAQIKAGIPREVPSETINKVCASGMRAIGLADQAIRAGDVEVAVTGGMESMSQAPYLLPGRGSASEWATSQAIDSMTHDGLTNPFTDKQMINEACEVGERARDHPRRHGPLRRPLPSARRQGDRRGLLAEEIVERHRQDEEGRGRGRGRRGDPPRHHRRDAGEAAGGRRRRRHPHGRQRAGRQRRRRRGGGRLRGVGERERAAADRAGPLLRQRSPTTSPTWRGPRRRRRQQALDKIGKTPDDVDLWEINEAFASVAINSVRMLGIDEDKVNVNGGAIALGHPIGASGARIVGALVHELRRRGGGLGCAAICSGGGQGDAIVVEVNGAGASIYGAGSRLTWPQSAAAIGGRARRGSRRALIGLQPQRRAGGGRARRAAGRRARERGRRAPNRPTSRSSAPGSPG